MCRTESTVITQALLWSRTRCAVATVITQVRASDHRNVTVQYLSPDRYLVAPGVVALVHPHHAVSEVPQCVQAVGPLLQSAERDVLVVRDPAEKDGRDEGEKTPQLCQGVRNMAALPRAKLRHLNTEVSKSSPGRPQCGSLTISSQLRT